MYTEEQKTQIKNSVYSLRASKRKKILTLVSLLSQEPDDDMQFDVMVSYIDDDMDDELDKALKDAQLGGLQVDYIQESESSVPSKLKIKK